MKKHFETSAIRTRISKTAQKEHSSPLFLTSSFMFDDAEEMRAMFADEKEGNIYSRFTNPNSTELIEKLNLLEETEAGAVMASGMSAIFTTFAALLSSGDHLLSCREIFGSARAGRT